MQNTRWVVRLTSCALYILLAASVVIAAADSPRDKLTAPQSAELEARISRLVEQLGDSQYHARERAQEELRRLGAVAFDALLAAQDHTDIEIALRARYLVRSLSIDWVKDGDSPIVKQMFKDYSGQERSERLTRAQHLSKLTDGAGVPALCRIMRFDPDRALSKTAAVLVMNSDWPATEPLRRERAEAIRGEVSYCKRPGAKWLLLYARTLEDPAEVLAEWEELVRGEAEVLARQPQETDHSLVRDLIRWQTQLLIREQRTDEALASMRRSYDLLGEDREELYELLDWSVEHGLHQVADELADRFAVQFQADPQLMYRLAESQLKRGEKELAEATAANARQLVPNNLQQHIEVAFALQRRLLPEWSEKEFRLVVEQTKPEEPVGARIRWALADMLFDWGQDLAAAEMAQTVVDTGVKNPQVYEFLDKESSEVQGYMHYYFGVYYGRIGERAKQQQHLREAIFHTPTNPDFVIAMFRVPEADAPWTKEVKERMDAITGQLRKEISAYEGVLQRPMSDEDRQQYGEDLGSKLNELAWLISNTEGDMQEALAASLKSLELVPDYPAFLDTLGRCYYSVGDYQNAVEAQSRAVKLMPSMYVMRRQLEFFEKKLAESRVKGPTN